MYNPDVMTTTQVTELLGINRYTVPKVFAAAYRGRRAGEATKCDKMWSRKAIAEIISAESGHTIKAIELGDLIKAGDAFVLLATMGRYRSRSSWENWRENGVGPRPFKLGNRWFYLASEVEAWAEHLPKVHRGFRRGQHPSVKRSQSGATVA